MMLSNENILFPRVTITLISERVCTVNKFGLNL